MYRFNAKEVGFYFPSFLCMQINTDEDLSDLNRVSPITKKAFLHEYIHFIQDITTTYGLINLHYMFYKFKAISEYASLTKTIQIPLPSLSNTIEINKDLFTLYEGTSDIFDKVDRVCDVSVSPNGLISGYENANEITTTFIDSFGIKRSVPFGAVCIIETMADLFEERLIYKTQLPDIPYKYTIHVAKCIYQNIGNRYDLIVALSDIALCSFHPADFFYNVATKMKSDGIIPSHPSTIYDVALRYRYNVDNTYLDLYDEIYSAVKKQISDCFQSSILAPVCQYLLDLIDKAHSLRHERPTFMCDIYTGRKISDLQGIINDLGIPLMSNKKGMSWAHAEGLPEKEQLLILRGMYEINSVLLGDQRNCRLKPFCINSNPDWVDEECDLSPWRKAEKELLCVFAQAWKIWGLSDKELKFKNS
jgi:hypothetical protein